jgi:hypothetical protein
MSLRVDLTIEQNPEQTGHKAKCCVKEQMRSSVQSLFPAGREAQQPTTKSKEVVKRLGDMALE